MLAQFENALQNLEREVTNIPMNPVLRDEILDEFQKLRNLMEQIPTNENRKKMTC
jgi:hypothetical protein